MKSLSPFFPTLLAGILFLLLVLTYSRGTADMLVQATMGPTLTWTGGSNYEQDVDLSIFLPLVHKQWRLPPSAPVLNPIDNPNGSYKFTVSWSTVELATSYILEEDDNASFSSPTTVYNGGSTSATISVDAMGTYYYRVKAINAFGESRWSNIRSTLVSSEPLACPEEGLWVGNLDSPNSDNVGDLHFQVVHTPECQVEELWVKLYDGCFGAFISFHYLGTFPISDLFFDNGHVSGTFISNTEAVGDYEITFTCEDDSYYRAGTWQGYFDSQ